MPQQTREQREASWSKTFFELSLVHRLFLLPSWIVGRRTSIEDTDYFFQRHLIGIQQVQTIGISIGKMAVLPFISPVYDCLLLQHRELAPPPLAE